MGKSATTRLLATMRLLLLSVVSTVSMAAPPGTDTPATATARGMAVSPAAAQIPSKDQLLGAWALVEIRYRDGDGDTLDPFYQAGSSGIIIYDSSGWMSVQISAPHRHRASVPEIRVPRSDKGEKADKATAFDSYYSYFGTWDYDATTGTVTHHLDSSLIPAETGLSYAQVATLQDKRLILTVTTGPAGHETVRRKVWRRL